MVSIPRIIHRSRTSTRWCACSFGSQGGIGSVTSEGITGILGKCRSHLRGTQRALQTWQAFQKEIAYLFPDAKYKVREVSLLRTAWLKIVDFDAHHSKDEVVRNLQNTYATLSGPIERVSDGTDFMHSRDLWASIYGGCSSYSMPGYGDAGAITRRYDAPSPVFIDHQTPMSASSSTRAYYQSE